MKNLESQSEHGHAPLPTADQSPTTAPDHGHGSSSVPAYAIMNSTAAIDTTPTRDTDSLLLHSGSRTLEQLMTDARNNAARSDPTVDDAAEPQQRHAVERATCAGTHGGWLLKTLVGGLFAMFGLIVGILGYNFSTINAQFATINAQFTDLRADVNADIERLDNRITAVDASLRAEMAEIRDEISEIRGQIADINSVLLELAKSVARIEGHLGIGDATTTSPAAQPAESDLLSDAGGGDLEGEFIASVDESIEEVLTEGAVTED